MFTGDYLRRLRGKAIRRHVLHCLDRLERGILYLSGRLVGEARSPCLVSQLLEIVQKLEQALTSRFKQHVESYGIPRLVELVRTACELGSDVASEWVLDLGFARYLAFIDLNR